MAERGYIKLARQSMESDIWHKPPLYWKIWTYILMRAKHQDDETAKRGEFIARMAEFQEAGTYYVGFRKVTPTDRQIRRVLDYLSGKVYESPNGNTNGPANGNTNGRMIVITKVKTGMLINVLNYAVYQGSEIYEGNNERSHERSANGPANGPRTGNPLSINKRIKEEKKEERIVMANPTLDTIREYIYTENLMVDPDRFFDYYESQGWKLSNGNKMKDWKASCRNWHRKEVEKMNQEKKKGLAF